MSIKIYLKRHLWPRTFYFTNNFRTYTLVIFVTIIITLMIYSFYYTTSNIMGESMILSETQGANRITARFEQRHKHLNDECKKLGLEKTQHDKYHKLNAWEFLINNQYGLVYCNVFKAASSSWLYNFNLLAGYSSDYLENTSKTPVSLARSKYPRPSYELLKEALNKHLSFIIVRHPFERLVSAYVDKFIKNSKKEYFRKIGKKIVAATRTRWKEFIGTNLTTLSDEVKQKVKELEYADDNLPPTFEEYIRYIICESKSKHKLDEHWEPMTRFCSPCQANFDLILKFETLEEDQNYLIKIAKLENIIEPKWKNPTNKDHKNISSIYFAHLSREQVHKLTTLYQYDFALFEYSPDQYFNYIQENHENLPCYSTLYKYL